jgi:hypothetical protein
VPNLLHFLQTAKFATHLFTDIYDFLKFHESTMEKTHNLEVPGSSPGWSTAENQALTSFSQVLFLLLVTFR